MWPADLDAGRGVAMSRRSASGRDGVAGRQAMAASVACPSASRSCSHVYSVQWLGWQSVRVATVLSTLGGAGIGRRAQPTRVFIIYGCQVVFGLKQFERQVSQYHGTIIWMDLTPAAGAAGRDCFPIVTNSPFESPRKTMWSSDSPMRVPTAQGCQPKSAQGRGRLLSQATKPCM
jgi:hypothetical protein